MCAVLFAIATLWRYIANANRKRRRLRAREARSAYIQNEHERVSQSEWERRAQTSLHASLKRRQNGGKRGKAH